MNNAFESQLDCPLSAKEAFNKPTNLPGGINQTLNLPGVGLVSGGIDIPTSPAPILSDAGLANFGLTPTSSNGSTSMSGGQLIESPMDNPLTPRG